MTVIIFAHPWHGSYNKAILDGITTKLANDNKPFKIIDLHKDEFNPVLTEQDLALYSKGEFADPLVGEYQAILKEAKQVVFIFPIWWSSMPAMLKGFLDKIFLVNYSHNYQNGWTPLLDINKTLVVTTSQSPTQKYATAIELEFIQNGLQAVGFKNTAWLNCDNVGFGTDEYRKEFIVKVTEAL